MNNKLRIAIYNEFPFPTGLSGTNRIISYSRGLVELGNRVHVFIGKPTEKFNQIFNNRSKGNFQGIDYTYPKNKIIKSKHSMIRGLEMILGFILTLKNIYREHRSNPFDVLFISNDFPLKVFILSYFAKLLKFNKCILIVDEYPNPIRFGGNSISKYSFLLFKHSFRRIDALFSMTHSLNDYYSNLFNVKHSLIVPMTVENDRFEGVSINKTNNYIAYVGNLEIAKDGIDILIHSFAIVYKHFPDLSLKLYGSGSITETKSLKKQVEELGLSGNVLFEGRIDRSSIPSVLCNAKALLLPRPSSKRAEGGFPTKLGEYLASGTPAVVTNVGEISAYLENEINAYIVEPDNARAFAESVLFVLNNPEESKIVGLKGKQVAKEKFNYYSQAKEMSKFIIQLN
ncbi:MAG: glycosyltransferase family 4 protein [Acholeplasma sp.]|nr:glycosyltransferase family 4 protein [Acholeplasma sp.]